MCRAHGDLGSGSDSADANSMYAARFSNCFRGNLCCSVNIWHPSQCSYDLLLRLLLFFDGGRKSPSAFDFGLQLINLCSRDIVTFDLVADSIVEIAVFVALYII